MKVYSREYGGENGGEGLWIGGGMRMKLILFGLEAATLMKLLLLLLYELRLGLDYRGSIGHWRVGIKVIPHHVTIKYTFLVSRIS